MEHTHFIASASKELEAEYRATRKCLERIPESLYEFKPHPKSMNLGYLALLVAEIPAWITYMIEEGEIDLATYPHFELSTTQDLTDHFEENFARAKESLKNATEEQLGRTFVMKNNGQEVFSIPTIENIPETLNHWVHHRGQLTVYMRLNDIAVPSIYGPSADDKNF